MHCNVLILILFVILTKVTAVKIWYTSLKHFYILRRVKIIIMRIDTTFCESEKKRNLVITRPWPLAIVQWQFPQLYSAMMCTALHFHTFAGCKQNCIKCKSLCWVDFINSLDLWKDSWYICQCLVFC